MRPILSGTKGAGHSAIKSEPGERKKMKRVASFEWLDLSPPPVFDWLDNNLLKHVLSYAWCSYYHLALVCRRFFSMTKSREYWRAIAVKAFYVKTNVPVPILHQVDWFFGLEPNEPLHFYLWTLWSARPSVFYTRTVDQVELMDVSARQIPVDANSTDVKTWSLAYGQEMAPGSFCIELRKLTVSNQEGHIKTKRMEPFYTTFFNNPYFQKELWMFSSDGNNVITLFLQFKYDEKIWYGAVENPVRVAGESTSSYTDWKPKLGFGVYCEPGSGT